MSSKLTIGQVVYYDDHRMIVIEGPYRALDAPGVDQYAVKTAGGLQRGVWRSDVLTEEEYLESLSE